MSCLANQSSESSGASVATLRRTQESAACADSRMTSPSCPVIVSFPEPGIAVASMNSTSPPTGVQARPVATPGSLVRRFDSAKKRRRPRSSRARLAETFSLAFGLALGDLARDLAADGADLALEVPHAGLARVLVGDRLEGGVSERDLAALEAVLLDLPRDEVALRDVDLLVERVAGELDHLHPVAERRRDRLERVRRGDEQDLGEVEARGRGSGRGTSRSAPGRAPRASRSTDRRGSRSPSCRSRRS